MRLLILSLSFGVYGYQLIFSNSGLIRYSQIQERITSKKLEIQNLETRQSYLNTKIQLVMRDPLSIEYAIREAYGYLKPNEIIIELKPKKKL